MILYANNKGTQTKLLRMKFMYTTFYTKIHHIFKLYSLSSTENQVIKILKQIKSMVA